MGLLSGRAGLAEEWFLPEPEPRPVRYTIVSVDDHLVEPRHMFEGRLPRHLQDQAPRVVETPPATRCGSSKATGTTSRA
jgi:hypothetical protein